MNNELAHNHPLTEHKYPSNYKFRDFLDYASEEKDFEVKQITIDPKKIQNIIKESTTIGADVPEDDLERKMFLAYNLALNPYHPRLLQT